MQNKQQLLRIKQEISLEDFEAMLKCLEYAEFIKIINNENGSVEIIWCATGKVIFYNSKLSELENKTPSFEDIMKYGDRPTTELVKEFDSIIEDAPLDFLGTGESKKYADKEEEEWFKRVNEFRRKLLLNERF